jgi:hypothetical protein
MQAVMADWQALEEISHESAHKREERFPQGVAGL